MANITNIEDSHNIVHTFNFEIFTQEKKLKITKHNLTEQEANEVAWKWLSNGLHEAIGTRIVCCDAININLVEIKKVKGK